MNVVSVMAHQDDEMICLGTMLKCQARGDTLSFITLTDGSEGVLEANLNRQAKATIRQGEMEALTRQVQARHFINLAEQDEFLLDTPEVRMKLIEAIRKSRADLIFTHYYDDYNLDHTITFQLVRQCAMLSCLPTLPTESEPLSAHPGIFMTEPESGFHFPASHYVDITEFHRRKIELLLSSHKSQDQAMGAYTHSAIEDYCTIRSAFRGAQAGCEHAEAFIPAPARGAIKAFNLLP